MKPKPFLIVALIVVLVVGTAVATLYIKGKFEIRKPVIEEKIEIDVATIEESIRGIAEIATVSYNYTDVLSFSDQKTMTLFGLELSLPGMSKSFIVCYDGEIKIGIDISQISIQESEGLITLTMPQAQVLSHAVDEASVRLLDENSGVFNPISVTDYTSVIADRKPQMEEKARLSGLFIQAQENAEEQMRILLMSLPGIAGEYEISFRYEPERLQEGSDQIG